MSIACMRWPFSLLCHLDGDCDGTGDRLLCRVHDRGRHLAFRLRWTA